MEEYFIAEENKKCVRAFFSVSDEEVTKKIESLKSWAEKKPNLPIESKNEEFLAIMLLRGKFREDVVKTNIENYFSYICRNPKMFMAFADIKPSEEVGMAVVSPKPTCTWERIGILKLRPEKLGRTLDINRCLALAIATALIMFNFDYCASVRIILDFEGFTLNHIKQVHINDLLGLMSLHENVLKMRISGIEFINAPSLFNVILNIAKVVLKPKLFSRISTHNDLQTLYKNVPREYLPREYGGELESVNELIHMWDETFMNKKHFFQKIEQLIEQNRPDDDMFGVVGSFKTLNID